MLLELHARDLGVIADLTLVFGPGMTAVTGETGAGKTLVVEAIQLLVGERAEPLLVRAGADEARVEGRFELDGDEVVVARVVPRTGRSRAYLDGRLASAAELAEVGARLVDLHGQHAHQSLLSVRAQREALDRFGAVDSTALRAATARLARVDADLAALGGDERSRAREADLLRYQLAELDAAAVDGPDEEDRLEAEDDLLAGAEAHREAAESAYAALASDGGAIDAAGAAVAALAGHRPFAELEVRMRALAAELGEMAADVRHAAEVVVVDPERLDEVRRRRRLLSDLRRKYGERLSDVLEYQVQARAQLAALEHHGERAQALEAQRAEVVAEVAEAAAGVAAARRAAAPRLAAAVAERLATLAMAGARLEVAVDGPDPADDVTFLLAANAGSPPLPLAKVASGGELARTMLALRLALGPGAAGGPQADTVVFDEVDAGIGGQAALAVGRALAEVATGPTGADRRRQVLVVTHLPQVAAFADAQVAVSKQERGGATTASAHTLTAEERVVELSRMLSGQPSSATARDHAEELLATATAARQKAR
ncbi:MAG: DNA repair protein RecN [Acidimicrobiia bacterium]